MNTFIIPWYTGTYYTIEQHAEGLLNPDYGDFRWEAQDLGSAGSGDNFLIVWMSDAHPFVVMKGFFLSDPEGGEIALRPTFITRTYSPLPKYSIPDSIRSHWREGMPLSEPDAAKLDASWEKYLASLEEDLFDGVLAERSRKPAANTDDAIQIACEFFCDKLDPLDGRPAVLSALSVAVLGGSEEEVICGALRDVFGREGWTAGRLREWGFTEKVVDSLLLYQWEEGETPGHHFNRLLGSGDRTAQAVTLREQEYRALIEGKQSQKDG